MCSVIALFRPGHDWPILVAANRDEMAGRPSRPPARHWPDRPEVTAGLDELAGGTWLGLSDFGMVAMVMNRPGTLGPEAGRRSRGELPLEALDHAEARAAAEALVHLDPGAYRPFNMVLADRRSGFWLRSDGDAVMVEALPPGVSMITAHDRNDAQSARIRGYLPRFEAAPAPDPEVGDWTAWERLLAAREFETGAGPHDAMCVVTETGFGTVSSSLLALPAPALTETSAVWLYADGRPGDVPFVPVSL